MEFSPSFVFVKEQKLSFTSGTKLISRELLKNSMLEINFLLNKLHNGAF